MEPRIWSTSDLAELKGWGPMEVRRALREGRLTRVRRGSFIEGAAPRPGEALRRAGEDLEDRLEGVYEGITA